MVDPKGWHSELARFLHVKSIPGGIWRLKTSKREKKIEHDLTLLDLRWPLIQQVPQCDRIGAIIKGESGLPIRVRSTAKGSAKWRGGWGTG